MGTGSCPECHFSAAGFDAALDSAVCFHAALDSAAHDGEGGGGRLFVGDET